jgi:methionine synthase I (cobalamin-dependent)/5,10-methylenetetrahydrofolate reductase
MAKVSFLEALAQRPLVFDGGMGTLLYERGMLYSTCFEEACLSNPALVRRVHQEYIQAGADVIETNTFGANAFRLKTHGLENKVKAINERAVELAREVACDAFVAASVGPTGLVIQSAVHTERDAIREAFREQCDALVTAGADMLMLETFRQPEELQLAMQGAQQAAAGRVPMVVQVSFDALGTMADGTEPEPMAELLARWGADVIGVNCATGPAGAFEMVTRMGGVGLPRVVQPNAGFPSRVDGRLAYMATPEYFLVYARRLYKAGVRAVGGCCGTTPDHVRKIASAARMMGAASSEEGGGMRESMPPVVAAGDSTPVLALEQKGFELGNKLGRKFVVSVEVNPPVGLSLDRALEGARQLKQGGVDVINVADGARATARMGNLALCARIQDLTGMPALMHVTTRDRNILGLVAHLLCAHELGVKNLVVITGDPPKMGDYPDATAVYDLDSIGLLRLVQGLNAGVDPGGKKLGGHTSFLCATGAEPAASDYDREVNRLRDKVHAGADFVMTQPVYDPAVLDRFLTDIGSVQAPVLVGILPLASYRNAEFLHNEVPGMQIPEHIRERMRRAGNGDLAKKEGVRIAQEMLQSVQSRVAGAYIMPPFGRYELALEVLHAVA